MQELVVPKSIPKIFAIFVVFLVNEFFQRAVSQFSFRLLCKNWAKTALKLIYKELQLNPKQQDSQIVTF